METILTCPLGSDCEKAVDGDIHRCAWYTKLQGMNPQTGQPMDEWACAIAWTPILLVENAREVKSVASATESRGNAVMQVLEDTKAMSSLNIVHDAITEL